MELFRRLKAVREEMGVSQVALSRLLGVSTSTVTAYEQGSRTPDEDYIEALGRESKLHPAVIRYGNDVLVQAANTESARRLRAAAAMLEETARLFDDVDAMDAASLRAMPNERKDQPPDSGQNEAEG